jgi:hypothetical protein
METLKKFMKKKLNTTHFSGQLKFIIVSPNIQNTKEQSHFMFINNLLKPYTYVDFLNFYHRSICEKLFQAQGMICTYAFLDYLRTFLQA